MELVKSHLVYIAAKNSLLMPTVPTSPVTVAKIIALRDGSYTEIGANTHGEKRQNFLAKYP